MSDIKTLHVTKYNPVFERYARIDYTAMPISVEMWEIRKPIEYFYHNDPLVAEAKAESFLLGK